MRKLAVALASVLALVGGAAPAAWADHGGGKSDKLEVIAKFTDFAEKDRGHKGPSKGDAIVFAYQLFTHGDRGHDKAGHGHGSCVFIDAGHDTFDCRCRAVFALKDGKILTAGKVSHDDFKDGKLTLKILGGDDEYKGAEGKAVVELLDHEGHDGHHGHSVSNHGDGRDGGMKGGKDGHGLAKVTFIFE